LREWDRHTTAQGQPEATNKNKQARRKAFNWHGLVPERLGHPAGIDAAMGADWGEPDAPQRFSLTKPPVDAA
jgi:hypothetical protein